MPRNPETGVLEKPDRSKPAKMDRRPRFYEPKDGWKGMTPMSVSTPSGQPLAYSLGPDRCPYSGLPWDAPALLVEVIYRAPLENLTLPSYRLCFPRQSYVAVSALAGETP